MELKFNIEAPTVRARDLSKRYGSKTALRFVTLDVEGQAVEILGVNGDGKSTFMNILTAIVSPADGYAEIAGYPAGSRASKPLLGFFPEFFFTPPKISPWMAISADQRIVRDVARS